MLCKAIHDRWLGKKERREGEEREKGGGHQRRNTTKCSHNGRNTQSEEKPSPPRLEWKLKRSKNVCFCCLLYFYCFPPCPQTCVNLKWLSILISPSLSRCLVKCVCVCVRVWVCACVCLTSFSILTKILNGWLINEKRLNRCVQKNDECGRKSESSDARNNSLERKRKDSISVTSDGERKKKLNVKLRLMNLGFSCRRRQRRHRRHRRQQRRTRNKTKWWIDKLSIWEVVKIRGLILMTAASLIDFFKHFVIIAAAAAVVKCNKTREERERARARERERGMCANLRKSEKERKRIFHTLSRCFDKIWADMFLNWWLLFIQKDIFFLFPLKFSILAKKIGRNDSKNGWIWSQQKETYIWKHFVRPSKTLLGGEKWSDWLVKVLAVKFQSKEELFYFERTILVGIDGVGFFSIGKK